MKHPVDVTIFVSSLWLLASEIIDILTPKAITGLVVAEALGPIVFVGLAIYAVRFYRRTTSSYRK